MMPLSWLHAAAPPPGERLLTAADLPAPYGPDPVVFGSLPPAHSQYQRTGSWFDRECGKCGAAWRGEAPCWACGSEAVTWAG